EPVGVVQLADQAVSAPDEFLAGGWIRRLGGHGLPAIKKLLDGRADANGTVREEIVYLADLAAVCLEPLALRTGFDQLSGQKAVVGTLDGNRLHPRPINPAPWLTEPAVCVSTVWRL